MKSYGVIAIGYNRLNSLKRLLTALNQADYQVYDILLIISLDFSDNTALLDLARSFEWNHGHKIIKTYPEKQGLRQHILKCGDYIEEYSLDAAAVFEDDTFPSPAYFNYMTQAVEFYEQDPRIAGISFYTHLWNATCEMPFTPLTSCYDVFFLQLAQSWGQIWTRRQWAEFKRWYIHHSENFSYADGVPENVCRWNDSSWLKYHIRFCVETDKYFVYPYDSLCTTFTDIGEHNLFSTTLFQVPLQTDSKKRYHFTAFAEAPVIYDSYFENKAIAKQSEFLNKDLCIDLYGSKPGFQGKKYWLTTQEADYKIIKAYGMCLRPPELNIIMNIDGSEIKLYDTEEGQKKPKDNFGFYKKYDYYFKLSHCAWKDILKYLISKFKIRLK